MILSLRRTVLELILLFFPLLIRVGITVSEKNIDIRYLENMLQLFQSFFRIIFATVMLFALLFSYCIEET